MINVENVDHGHAWACPNTTPQNCLFRWGIRAPAQYMAPWDPSSPQPKRHLDRFIRFGTAHAHGTGCVCVCVCLCVCLSQLRALQKRMNRSRCRSRYGLGGHAHTHTHPFNGPLSGTTRVSWYQKGKTNLDFTEARDSERQ